MDTLLPARDTALLLVDIQERLLPAMPADGRDRLLRNTLNLVAGARACGVPLLCTEQYPRGLGPTVPELRAVLTEPALDKQTFSALGHPQVVAWFNQQKKRRVVVVGMEAHVCVHLTARDLVQEGFMVSVPHDAVLSRRDDDRRTALDLMRQSGVAVTTTETILFDWMGASTHAAFKDLSARIR